MKISDVCYKVYDVLGGAVKEIRLEPTFSKGEIEVDVSSLPPGIYYISLKAGGERITKQFAVAR